MEENLSESANVESAQAQIKKTRFEYKWVIVGLCFAMMFICLGFGSGIRSHFIVPITENLNITRGEFSFNETFRFIATSIVNLFFGFLVAKFGAKKMMFGGFVALIGAMCSYALATNVWLIYLGGILLGTGIAWTGTTLVGFIVAKWFKQNRGTIMGIILCANACGSAIANLIIVKPLVYGSPEGYKDAYYIIAICVAVIAVFMMLFYREPKEGEGEQGEVKGKKKRGRAWSGIEFKDAIRKPYFYMAVFCIAGTGIILQGTGGVSAAHLNDVGIDTAFIADVSVLSSVMLAVMKFVSGFMYDKFGLRLTITICSVAAIGELVLLCVITNSDLGRVLVVARTILGAVALPLETIIIPLYACDLFGEKCYSKMLGVFISASTAGCALGSPILNFCFDAMGSYVSAFWGSVILMAIVVVMLQYVITAGHKIRKEVEEQERLQALEQVDL
ncbi:MAG: MFS transporter [Clostridia bacterium]|nr:MFS transporter [Clostridia bacterium]